MARRSGWRRGRGNPALYWLRGQFGQRPLPVWIVVVCHVMALGIALVIYALPHHVIPHAETAVGIVSSRDGRTAEAIATEESAAVSTESANVENTDGASEVPDGDIWDGEMEELVQAGEELPPGQTQEEPADA